jgi:hypothetical protein
MVHGDKAGTETISATPAALLMMNVFVINTLYVEPYGKVGNTLLNTQISDV